MNIAEFRAIRKKAGKPLTDEAMQMVTEGLEALKDES